ncbi:MAG: mannose-6-phosphate isomerase, class I [Rhodoglobus sp.]
MFVGITNTPRDYAWGSAGEISALLGRESTGKPEAELWLGAHAGSPSAIVDPAKAGGAKNLSEWIARDGATILGVENSQLPFLLKILAAEAPLSLQAHPTEHQARAGFARENAAGLSLTDNQRNYKDASAKPELIVAVSDTFEALCGFRPLADTAKSITRLAELDAETADPQPAVFAAWLAFTRGQNDIRAMFEWLIAADDPVPQLVKRVTALADGAGEEFALVRTLAAHYPGDPGLLIALMLNRVTLHQGEALFLPAGNIHAYLRGVGIELMASSDNVLRGGLTPKHVDVAELLSVLDFSASGVPYLRPEMPSGTVRVYRPPVTDFQLIVVEGECSLELPSAAIVLCTAGEFTLTGHSGERESVSVARGESVFVTADERLLTIRGSGQMFVAATQ